MLLARNPKARAAFQQAFEARAVEKYYLAVIGREIDGDEGVIDLPVSKVSSAEAGWRMVGDPAGQAAVTRWRKLAVRDGRTLVEFQPLTGRTHQIRVHAREAFGSGIVGDRVYGIPGGPMLLHASRLVVPRTRKPAIDVTAPLPDTFGDWRDDGLKTLSFPEDALSGELPRRDRARRPERQQGRDRGPAAGRPVQARAEPGGV